MNEVALLTMLGVSNSKVMVAASKTASHLMTIHPFAKFQEAVQHAAPEVQAVLLVTTLGPLKELVLSSVNEAVHLKTIGQWSESDETLRLTYVNNLIDRYESVAVAIRSACALRAAAGWPEWDTEKGCPVGEERVEPGTPVDLGGLLSGIDMSWLDDDPPAAEPTEGAA